MNKLITVLILALNLNIQAQTVKIAAAADLRYALDELVKAYKTTNVASNIEVVYGSSGQVFTQILHGAPFDIYFSADIFYPHKLEDAGLTITPPKLYAIGRIVLWSATLDISKGLTVLTENPNVKIATANPDHAPYGKRSVEALKQCNIFSKVEKQLIFGENISQAAQFCLSGNADAGLLALSLVQSPTMKALGKYYLIDEKLHQPLQQAYVLLKPAKGKSVAFAFVDFLETQPAKIIFEKYGFTLSTKP
jgi:molybdate transport system substrate-binding protein